jgi:hypothetical protein
MTYAKFARSGFGGGWILPDGPEAIEICESYFGEPAIPLAPIGGALGYIIEPQDVTDTVEGLRDAGCKVTL